MQDILRIKNHTIGEGIPLICVPVMGESKEKILSEAKRFVAMGVDMIEWRVDAFEEPTDMNAIRAVLAELAPVVKDTVLVYTFRSKSQGGLAQLSSEEVSDVHMVAAESGVVDLIDVEYFAQKRPQREIALLQSKGAHVIASHHDFSETPQLDIIRMILERMKDSGADVVKLAVMPQDSDDVLTLLAETGWFHQNYPNVPLITMAMGSLGGVTRLSGETFGSCVTFASAGQSSAPGQMPYADVKRILQLLHEEENSDE